MVMTVRTIMMMGTVGTIRMVMMVGTVRGFGGSGFGKDGVDSRNSNESGDVMMGR